MRRPVGVRHIDMCDRLPCAVGGRFRILPSTIIRMATGVANSEPPIGEETSIAIVDLHQCAFAAHHIDAVDLEKALVAPVIRDHHLGGKVTGDLLDEGFDTGTRRQRMPPSSTSTR
jgi:hypothetical protein